MFAQWRQRISERTLRSRAAEPGTVFLDLRRVYIVPTGAGWGYVGMLILLFIGAINYNLSLGFALTFLLIGVALIDMHMTYRNLAHLHLVPNRSHAIFAGETAQFELSIANQKNLDRYAIWIGFVDPQQDFPEQALDLAEHSSTSVTLSVPSQQRGWLAAPKVRLRTRFPLGLLVAWSYWQPSLQCLVYPAPEIDAPPLPQAARQIAKLDLHDGGELVTKHFEGGSSTQLHLDFAQLPAHLDIESKLARMTRWVLQAEQEGLRYAFSLGDVELGLGQGSAHQTACLRALALFDGQRVCS
ncbi:MAG: hypothetical protein HYZ45_08720 [Burkholderiales bacterium]|nr:hypothetical protein [Burkholderiales bacterium]